MSESTVRSVHMSGPLTEFSVGYRPEGAIAEQAVAVVPVAKEADFYYKFRQGEALRRVDTRWADGTRANRTNLGFDRAAYLCEAFALEDQLTDRVRDNADSILRIEMHKIRNLQDKILMDQEARVASLLTTAANYAGTNTATLSGTDQWNNASFAGSIEKLFDDARDTVRQLTGNNLRPDMAIIPEAVTLVLKRDAKVRELLKYTHDDLVVSGGLPPKLWNLKVVVPSIVENTAAEVYGADSFTGSDIWGKNVVLTKTPTHPSIETPAHCYIFRSRDVRVETWREDETASNWYRVSYIQCEHVVSNVGGYLFKAVIA